jgi:HK97 family phage major capsid protein
VDRTKLEARLQAIADEAATLIDEQRTEADLDVSEQDEEKFAERDSTLAELADERVKIDGQLKRLDRIDKLAADKKHLVDGVDFRVNQNTKKDPFDLNELRWNSPAAELRGRAKTAIEEVEAHLTDGQREAVTEKLATVDDPRGVIPGLILRTGNDDYRKAFQKAMAGRQDLWTHDERQAVAALDEWRTMLGLTGDQGGFAVPFTLDTTLILTNAGTVNPMRQISRNVSIATDVWNGLSSAGVTGAWKQESAEAVEDSVVFAQPSIPVELANVFIRGSIEISQDFQNIEAMLSEVIADAKDRLEGAAFINGTGAANAQPDGIIAALDGGSSEVSPGVAETFAVGDVYKVQSALSPRYQGNASWVADLSTINAMRQFATANNYHAFLTDLAGGQPSQLLGQPLFQSSDMDPFSAIDESETDGNNHILLYGDFRNYVIVDRIGLTLEYIPHLFNTGTNFPSGERGWYAYWRVGADSVNDAAFRVLTVATTS